MTGYVAVSAPLHCADGWSFLGRAVAAILLGDATAARHLGYYAELRAAMSLMAAHGVGIFNRTHFVVVTADDCRLVPQGSWPQRTLPTTDDQNSTLVLTPAKRLPLTITGSGAQARHSGDSRSRLAKFFGPLHPASTARGSSPVGPAKQSAQEPPLGAFFVACGKVPRSLTRSIASIRRPAVRAIA